MLAAVVPKANGKWNVQEVPTPRAGHGEVLIKIHASGICYTDVHQTRGSLPGEFPRILGHEPVGEIVEVGPGVKTRKVGDRVGVPWVQSSCGRCEWCARHKPFFCSDAQGTSVQKEGGHAQFMLACANATVLLPEGISYEQGAPIFCAGFTVWSGLRWADPKPGERVAVVGVGGLGHLGVQYAKAAGFETIAVSRSPDKDALIRQLGADEVVRNGEGLRAAGGADVILGTSNSSEAMADAIKGIRPDGRLVVMGFDPRPLPLSIGDLIFRRMRVMGSTQNLPEHLYEALSFVAAGKVKVMVETYRLDAIAEAYERVEKGLARFRAVVVLP